MSSGKSLQLLSTAYNFQEHNIPFVVLKSSVDTRDGKNVVHSRALGDRECITISPTDSIFELLGVLNTKICEFRWILVDEAQFLTKRQVEELAAIADIKDVNVLCYGLRTDFLTNLFEGSKRLFEIADTIEEIKSACDCGCKTIFNARIDEDNQIILKGEQVEIGGDDKYVSYCRKCYIDKAIAIDERTTNKE